VPSSREWCDDAGALRRFGRALVRDDRFVCDDVSAAALVDKLFRQASLTLIEDRGGDQRSLKARSFGQFVRLYRRHIRKLAADDADSGWGECATPPNRSCGSVTAGVRALPLDLREALLLIALAGFSHREAAETLDLPLAAVIDRLGRARARLAAHIGVAKSSAAETPLWSNAAHLRIVK